MKKHNYFERLERLSHLALQSMRMDGEPTEDGGLNGAATLLCECELALFAEFLPPLERHSIAMLAHALYRVLLEAKRFRHAASSPLLRGEAEEEYRLCLAMAEQLHREIRWLRTVRKPQAVPDLSAFRQLELSARTAHLRLGQRLSDGTLPRAASEAVLRLDSLRDALVRAFDCLVEVMLMNI